MSERNRGMAAAVLWLALAVSCGEAAAQVNDCSISTSPPSGPTTPVAPGTTVTITALCNHNPSTYHWNTGSTAQFFSVVVNTTTQYTVSATNSAGTNTISFTVNVARPTDTGPIFGPVTDPTARLTGSFSVSDSAGGSFLGSFSCSGVPTCTGAVTMTEKDTGCSNSFTFTGGVTFTGVDVSHAGTFSGQVALTTDTNSNVLADGTCAYSLRTTGGHGDPYDAIWDGTHGKFTVHVADSDGTHFEVPGTFTSNVSLPPVFPMKVTSSITETVSTASAQIQFRPADAGSTGSVFVFALAPATLVKGAKAAHGPGIAVTATDAATTCVLAQLGPDGQLHAVASASELAAFISNILLSQGQAVSILNNVPTPNVAGANFFVGYGANATSMINGGVNQTAVTIPGAVSCAPQVPQTGWWWNPAEGGRGFSIEVQGNNLFFAVFHYDASGRATWNVSPGPVSLGGAFFTSDLYQVVNGQTLFGAYKAPSNSKIGTLTLAFTDASHGTLIWPGGSIPIERQNFIPGSLAAPPLANQPESGWWWNPDESGRGFFIEWQQDRADIAGYMYDDNGNPVWYISVYPTPDARVFSGNWWTFANGQAMGGTYKPATFTSDHFAPLSITFTSAVTATMQLPGGRTTNLIRQHF